MAPAQQAQRHSSENEKHARQTCCLCSAIALHARLGARSAQGCIIHLGFILRYALRRAEGTCCHIPRRSQQQHVQLCCVVTLLCSPVS